jgi:hypothetical protein
MDGSSKKYDFYCFLCIFLTHSSKKLFRMSDNGRSEKLRKEDWIGFSSIPSIRPCSCAVLVIALEIESGLLAESIT